MRSSLVRRFISFVGGSLTRFIARPVLIVDGLSIEKPSAPPPEETDIAGSDPGHEEYPSLFSNTSLGTLYEADWTTYPLDSLDVVHSYLVDHPTQYYLTPNRQRLYLLTRRRGLMMLTQDFTQVTDEWLSTFVFYFRRGQE